MLKQLCTIASVSLLVISCGNNGEDSTAQEPRKQDSAVVTVSANPYVVNDISPMDMSYFPVNYPQRKMTHELTDLPVMRVIYSRPHRQGRTIFGNLLKYGEPWRLGANEASEIEFFQNVSISGKKITPGRYVIYCVPYPDRWKILLNNDHYTWGLKIDSTKDAMNFEIPAKKIDSNIEFFTMVFQPAAGGAELVMAWDNTEARLPITFQ